MCFNVSVSTDSTKALRKGQVATTEITALHVKTIISNIFFSPYRPQVVGRVPYFLQQTISGYKFNHIKQAPKYHTVQEIILLRQFLVIQISSPEICFVFLILYTSSNFKECFFWGDYTFSLDLLQYQLLKGNTIWSGNISQNKKEGKLSIW